MKSFKKLLSILILFFIVLVCSACVHKNSTTSTKKALQAKSFYFTQIADVPINHDSSYFIEFYNWSDNAISLDKKDFIIDHVDLKKEYTILDLLDVSQCQSLGAHSSCRIPLNLHNKFNNTNGSFAITVNKKEIKAVTMIKYFTSRDDVDFDVQYHDTNTMFHFSRAQPISVNIPIVFNKDFYDIKVTKDSDISYQFLNCDMNHFIKNTVCILQINTQGGKAFNNMIKVTGKKDVDDKDASIILATPIVNAMSNFGNLLVGLSSTSITANGTSTVTLYLANNGLGTISNITTSFVQASSTLSISANTCTSGIVSNGSCYMTIATSANSSVWYVDGVILQYNDGLNNNTIKALLNVLPNGGYGTLNLSTSGNFITTKVNTTATLTLTVQNTGSLPVSNISVTKVGMPTTITQYQNTCTSTLAAGSSCQYVFQYKPTAVKSASSFSFVINGQYTSAAIPYTISNINVIQYSAIISGGYLSFSLNTMLYNTNLVGTATQVVIVTNVGGATVSNLSVDFSAVASSNNYAVLTTLPVNYAGTYSNCNGLSSLAVNAKCALAIQLTPDSAYFDAGFFEIDYTVSSQNNADYLAYQTNIVSSNVNISVSQSVSGQSSGSGTSSSPYIVNTANGQDFTITYTYTNTGTAAANNFAISPDLLLAVYYWQINKSASTCPMGSTTTLAAGSSCTLSLTGLNYYLYNYPQLSGAYNLHTPDVSFTDNNGVFIRLNNFGDNYINFIPMYSLSINESTTFNTSNNTISSKFTTTVQSSSGNYSITPQINSPYGSNISYTNDGSSSSLGQCVISSPTVGASCWSTITYNNLSQNDTAIIRILGGSSGSAVSYYTINRISALAYIYTQNSTQLRAWRLNTDYSMTQVGSTIPITSSYTSVVYNNQLLLFTSASTIVAYPINNDGSLGSSTNVTVSPAFASTPQAVTVSNVNGSLYASVTSASYIKTYKCGAISGSTITCTNNTSSNTYTGNILEIASGFYTSANTLFYASSSNNQVQYSTNDGTTVTANGAAATGNLATIATSNYRYDQSMVLCDSVSSCYTNSYNANGTMGSTFTGLTLKNAAGTGNLGAIGQLFWLETGLNYQLPVSLVASISNGGFLINYLTGANKGNSIPVTSLTTEQQFAVYVPFTA
jgi:hypothetical protein